MDYEKEIIKMLRSYLSAYPRSSINEEILLVYARALARLSTAEIDGAMLKLIQTNKAFPSVAEIFEQVGILADVVNGTGDKTADEAWSEVLREAHDAFIYRKPKFSTKEIEQAVYNMGWASLCNLKIAGIYRARAQFMGIYKSILKRKEEAVINCRGIAGLPVNGAKKMAKQSVLKLSLLRGKAADQ